MARSQTKLQNSFPYHLTARSNNKDWYRLSMINLWSIYRVNVQILNEKFGFRTHGFVLMANHFHWIVSTPQSNLSRGMRYFMTETSKEIGRQTNRINKIYGDRYRWSILTSHLYYANAIRYIFQNPLRAGICESVWDYHWSTLNSQFAVHADPWHMNNFIPKDPEQLSAWLNHLPPSLTNSLISKALRRGVFRFPRHPTTNRRLRGDEEMFMMR